MNRQKIMKSVENWLEGNGWEYGVSQKRPMLAMGIPLKSSLKKASVLVDVKEDGYLVYVVAPEKGTPQVIGDLVKFLTWANYSLINGNFELDINSGEIRYKTYVDCDGIQEIPAAVVRDSIEIAIAMMNRFGNSIDSILKGKSDADREIRKGR